MKILKARKIFVDGKFEEGKIAIVVNDKIEDIVPVSDAELFKNFVEYYEFEDGILLPGFVDTHTHMMGYGINSVNSLEDTTSWEEAAERIRNTLNNQDLEVYIFTEFDESKWKEGKLPTREDLDKISKKKPIFLRRVCGHIGVGNTPFLNLILSRSQFDLSKISEVDGIFLEDVPLHINNLFPPSMELLNKAFDLAQERFIKEGITTISEIGGLRNFKFLQKKWKDGELKIRVRYYVEGVEPDILILAGVESGLGDDFFKVMGVKYFADGSVGGESAYFSFPYGERKKQGLFLLPDNFESILKKYFENNIQVAVHAIGNLAIKKLIEIAERIKTPELLRIEHCEFPDRDDIPRIARRKIKVSMQPNFAGNWGMEMGLYHKKLGDFYRFNNPINTFIKEGVWYAFGSDAMPPSPLFGIKSAINHPIQEERIDIEEAISRYTEYGAYLTFDEGDIGKIAHGYKADFVVMDEKLEKVKAVFINGRKVYNG
jgi:predicted amidohydrolase YtcJ